MKRVGNASMLFLILMALAFSAVGVMPAQAAPADESSSSPTLTDLPIAAQPAVSDALGRGDTDYHFVPGADGYRVENAAHGLVTDFSPAGMTLRSGDARWTLALQAIGYGEMLVSVAGAEPAIGESANRLEYVRGNLTEWYINGPFGLEQGFTLASRPAVDDGGALTLAFAMDGNVQPRLNADATALELVNEEGGIAFRYAGLHAYDAGGKTLRAWMESPTDGTFQIRVDDTGARYPLTIDPWVQQAYLKASNTAADDNFGNSVAISGDTLVVGAYGEDSSATGVNGSQSDNSATGSGAVYVFTRNDGAWSQQAYLKASNTGAGDSFGSSVAISGDTLVVGASGEESNASGVNGNQSDNSAPGSGAVYVFTRNDGAWSQQAYLKASNTGEWDNFGGSVAILGDTIVVGAHGESSNATGVNGDQSNNFVSGAGAAYVFTHYDGAWSQQAYLKASNTGAGDCFGGSVAISGDTIVVGAYGEDSNATGVNGDGNDNSAGDSGAAYVFMRSGGTWNQQAYLKASNPGAGGILVYGDSFGISVAISDDTIVVGAMFEDSNATGVNGDGNDNSASDSGAAYVFARSGGAWSQQAYLKASNTGAGDCFGGSVAILGDTIVVGAPGEDSNATGVNGNQSNNSVSGAGAAYVFTRSGGVWSQQAYLKASNTGAGDCFGGSVAILGDTIVVGAVSEDSNATGVNGNQSDNSASGSGAAYVFNVGYTVSYDANSATGGTVPDNQTKTHGVDLTLATNTGSLVKDGYTFTGWNTAANGSGTHYNAGGTYTANEAVTLYAEWTANSYTLTFDGNGGSPVASITLPYGSAVTAPANPTRVGYTFAGWTPPIPATMPFGGATLYAQWAADTYTVSYDANSTTGGTAPGSQTKTYGVDLTLATNSGSLVRTGYTFNGWNTANDGSGDHYAAGGTYTANAAAILFAEWKENAPVVQSITLAGINPIDGAGLDFTVTFDKPVSGVDKDDFSLTKTGSIMGAAVTKVVAVSRSVYTVTVYSGIGNGSIRLDLPATATIQDLSANAFVGPYTGGETYIASKGAAPTVPVLKLPKNKSLLTTSTPTLDWDDSSQVMALATGWHYEIQVTAPYGVYNETFNTDASADPSVGLGASTFTIPAEKSLPANTTFTWRVRAFDAAYRYSAWSKEFTFDTGKSVTPPTEGAPTVPALKLPKNKSLVAGYTLVRLDWNDSTLPATATPGSLYYEVRVTSPYRNYNAAFATAPGAASEYTIPAETLLPADSTFTWQVRSACNDGATTKYSAWSKEFTFRTKLATPTLLSPIDDAVTPLDNIRPTFTWEPVSDAAGYTILVLNQDGKTVATGTVKAPAYSFTPKKDLLPNATHTWKVKANGRNPGDYSAPFTFLTGASAPAIPTLTTPKNNTLVESAAEQTLVWSLVDNTTPAVSYQVEYATNAAFLESTTLPAADKQLLLSGGTLLPGRTYYWRVRSWSGADATGMHSPWSKARTIKVKFVAPVQDSVTVTGGSPTFVWHSDNGFWKNYTLLVLDSTTNKVVKSYTVPAPITTYTIPAAMLPAGTYKWQVKINGLYTPISSTVSTDTFTK